MKSTKIVFTTLVSVLLLILLSAWFATPGTAQGNKPLNLEFVAAGGGPPTVTVDNGIVLFKVTAMESVTGDLAGTLIEKITQVYPLSAEDGLLPVTTSWKLQTPDGTIEGYYAGEFQHLQDGTHLITEHGEVLSVTGAYISLYQAKVSYHAVLLADHMTVSGTMTIHPRDK